MNHNGPFGAATTEVCQNCGNVTVLYENNKKSTIVYPILGWLFTAISFLFIPIVFGVLGGLMGFFTYHDRSQLHGMIIMFFSAMGLILGSMLSFMVAGTMFF